MYHSKEVSNAKRGLEDVIFLRKKERGINEINK